VVWDLPGDVPRTPSGLPDLAADPTPVRPAARRTVVDGHPTFRREGA